MANTKQSVLVEQHIALWRLPEKELLVSTATWSWKRRMILFEASWMLFSWPRICSDRMIQ